MPNSRALDFAIAVLATWRLATMLYYEYGPANVWFRLRRFCERYPFLHKQVSCFWCCALFAGFLVWPVYVYAAWLLVPLALSGAVVLLSGGGRTIWRETVED